MKETDLNKINDMLGRTFEEFKKRNDQALEEMEQRNGVETGETRAAVEKVESDITEIRKAMKEIEVRMNRPDFSPEGEQTEEQQLHHRAFEKYLRVGKNPDEDSQFAFTPDEQRALTSQSDGSGGFLVPIDYEGGIIMNAYNLAELRPICQVGTTGRDVVQLGALSKPSVGWGRAGVQISTQTLTAGGRRITIYPLYGLTTVAVDTLDDAEANIEQELNDAFSRAIAEAEDDAYAASAGDDSPKGVVADTNVQANYVASGVAAAISDANNNGVDVLIEMLQSLNKIYRRNATWAMNSTTEGLVRKLKNGEGDYIWAMGVGATGTVGANPPTLLGRPIVNPEGMPDVSAGTYPIVIGDFMAGYKIRDNRGLSVQRLVEKYADYDQIGFKVKKRTGGMVTLPEAFVPMKIATS